jgi:hypothetical protein
LHTLRLRVVGPATRGAFENAPPFQLRCNAMDRKDHVGEVGRGIKERFGQGPDTGPCLFDLGDDQ